MDPPPPLPCAVTTTANVAVMEHASEIGAVVKVLPLKLPPQPLTLEML
jgi:hypothetical protein